MVTEEKHQITIERLLLKGDTSRGVQLARRDRETNYREGGNIYKARSSIESL